MDKYFVFDNPGKKYRLRTNIAGYFGNSALNGTTRLIGDIFKNISPARENLPVFMFMIPEGQGLRTAAKLLASRMSEKSLDGKRSRQHLNYYKLTPEDVSLNIPGTINDILKSIRSNDRAGTRFAVVDLDGYTGRKVYDSLVTKLLRLINDLKGIRTFILRIPPTGRETVVNMLDYISNYISIRLIDFPVISAEEALEHTKFRMENERKLVFDQEAEQSYRQYFQNHIDHGKYFGFGTIGKIREEIYLGYATDRSENKPPVIGRRHIAPYISRFGSETNSGSALDELNELIGLNDIKEQIYEIVKTSEFKKKSGINDIRTLHLMMTGQPGTGKTVVARLFGKILKECGILKYGRLIEVGRKDLIGEYMGQTALKTIDACRMAYGSILFVDEAYAFAKEDNDRYGFEQEALTTLIAEMENNRDKFVVIMAGYKKEMDQLCKTNAGLRDRFAFRIDFPSYTGGQLFDIFKLQVKQRGFKLSDEASALVQKYLLGLSASVISDKNFSNARFVRNITERIISKLSIRVVNSGFTDVSNIILFCDADSALKDNDLKVLNSGKERKLIGF